MPSTILPPWPNFVFAIFEPASLLAAWCAVWLGDLQSFIADQAPQWPSPPIDQSTTAIGLQLGNLYLLLMMLGAVVLYSTNDPKLVRNYLVALAIADVGHIYATGLVLGWDATLDVVGWNYMTWGNVGVTFFLFVNRLFYFVGFFGDANASIGNKMKQV